MKQKIAIIGGGNLGTAIAEGLIASRFAKPADIIITKRNPSWLSILTLCWVGFVLCSFAAFR